MNLSKTTAAAALILGIGLVTISSQSCKKSSSSSTPMTLYDSLGGSAMVNDPANPGTNVEKGYLGTSGPFGVGAVWPLA